MVETDALALLGHRAEERGDFDTARAAFERGAQLGCVICIDRLAYMYDVGIGGVIDKALAMTLYRRAWRLHRCGVAAANIGILYRERGDHRARARWLRKLVVRNDGSAQLELAKCHLTGTGVRKDVQAALRYLSAAARSGDISEGEREEAAELLETLRPRKV